MPIRHCNHCDTHFIVGVVPEPGSEYCRLCGNALTAAVSETSRNGGLGSALAYGSETPEEENQRLRDELQTTRLRSQQLRSDARKGRQALTEQVELSRAARASRGALPIQEK